MCNAEGKCVSCYEYTQEGTSVLPIFDEASTSCKACPTEGNIYWSRMTGECVEACPGLSSNSIPDSASGNICPTCKEMSKLYVFFDPSENKCVERCSEAYDDNYVCYTCPKKYLIDE